MIKLIGWLVLSSLLIAESSVVEASVKVDHGYQVIDPDRLVLKRLMKDLPVSIDHVSSMGFEIYGNDQLESVLISLNAKYFRMEPVSAKMTADYPTPEAIIKSMQVIQQKYANLVSLIEIGKSVQGRSLMVARLTAPEKTGVSPVSARPEFKYVANMHGDEIMGRELMIRLIADLAENYGKDSRITQILDQYQVYIMPSMNPDGALKRTRHNANGVDLNRSFPDFSTSDNQNSWGGREPEIQAMMKFQAKHKFKLSANFHGGAEVVNYPYDTIASPFPLQNFVKMISLNYSRKIPYFWNSTEFKNGITNGYEWYEVDGGMQDWSYHWHQDVQVTIELTQTKWPSYSTVDRYYQDNRNSLLGYIEETGNF